MFDEFYSVDFVSSTIVSPSMFRRMDEEIVGMTVFMAPPLTGNKAVSHEFINALTSVRSLSRLLVDYPGLADTDRTRFLSIIHDETERLMRLLADLDDGCGQSRAIMDLTG